MILNYLRKISCNYHMIIFGVSQLLLIKLWTFFLVNTIFNVGGWCIETYVVEHSC